MKNKFFMLLLVAATSFFGCSLSRSTLNFALKAEYPENPALDSIMQPVSTVMTKEPTSVAECDSVSSFLKRELFKIHYLPSPGVGVPKAKANFYIFERWNNQRRDSLKALD